MTFSDQLETLFTVLEQHALYGRMSSDIDQDARDRAAEIVGRIRAAIASSPTSTPDNPPRIVIGELSGSYKQRGH